MKFKDVVFEKDRIVFHKKSGDVVIRLNEIKSIEYAKPSIFNYLLSAISHGASTFPGRLEIRTKVKISKSKLHLVTIKFEEVLMLPNYLLEVIDPYDNFKWK